MATPNILTIPCKLDAFVLNAAVCGGSSKNASDDLNKDAAKIAPLAQPNYTFLRFEKTWVQNDILNFTDLHKTGPAAFNPRFTNLGTGEAITGRQGIYLHWIVPRPYRTGSAISQDESTRQEARRVSGHKHRPQKQADINTRSGIGGAGDQIPEDSVAPSFNPAPSRWLVIRKVTACDPPNALPEADAWVIESDRCHNLDNISTDRDLQVEFSPFIQGGTAQSLTQDSINHQAEIFIGFRESLNQWHEQQDTPRESSEPPQRVELNLLNSSNQLFADYQPHNGNVFSTIDNLTYTSADKGTQVVNTADVSYYVLGWHPVEGQDPLGTLDPKSDVTRAQRLSALNMILGQGPAPSSGPIHDWLKSTEPARIMCHGAMYAVKWNKDSKPTNIPADVHYTKLQKNMPIAIGTTPQDALQAYLSCHAAAGDANAAIIKDVKQDLLRLQKFRLGRGEGVEEQAEAADMLYDGNFSSLAGGQHYFLAASDSGKSDKGKPTAPDPKNITRLTALNNNQRYLDSLQRQLKLLRWSMFVSWWQFMTVLHPREQATMATPQLSADVKDLSGRILDIMRQIKNASAAVDDAAKLIPEGLASKGTLPPFYQARDPTMLVAGVETGWAWDYLDLLRTRVDTQLYYEQGKTPSGSGSWDQLSKNVVAKLPSVLSQTAIGLIGEFLALDPQSSTHPLSPQSGYEIPLYHDVDKKNALPNGRMPYRDRWEDSQAWFPLFLEWQAEYTHIPLDPKKPLWTLDERGAWPHDPTKLRYAIKPDVVLQGIEPPLCDRRSVSGRVLLLPQATLSTQTIVKEALASASCLVPHDLLDDAECEKIHEQLNQLSFLSSPLAGFTDHLLTRVQGNHVKPCLRDGDTVQPFQGAIDVSRGSDFGAAELYMMGIETDLVPYGILVPYLSKENCPFKPVTHGQFRFTALNIIDKFGQAVPLIDPTPTKTSVGPPALDLCISEYYAPEVVDETAKTPVANTVIQDATGACRYVQLPPSINQYSRLNAEFMDYRADDGTPGAWQAVTEWEDPIWGWVIPNYANSGIQLFLADGTFFREIRVGGPVGAQESDKWSPFGRPTENVPSNPNVMQLQKFATQLANEDYLASFIEMINRSSGTAAPPPTSYAEFLGAIIGRPLALVRVGYSLELATDQLFNTSTIDGVPSVPDIPLLPSKSDPDKHYKFQMQFGDASRVYDGLVAYFRPNDAPIPGDALDLTMMYTHFKPPPTTPPAPPSPPTPNLTKISESNYPMISPTWIDPMDQDIVNANSPGAAYAAKRVKNLQPFGALIDPFVPLHVYTGILPTSSLRVPNWSWQTALSRMTAFFHMGPLLTPMPLPKFCADYEASQDHYDVADDRNVLMGSGLGIPAMQAGDWAWLQPYYDDGTLSMPSQYAPAATTTGTGKEKLQSGTPPDGETGATRYMAMDLTAVDQRPRFEKTPYVAVEGYMQLRKPIQQAEVPAT